MARGRTTRSWANRATTTSSQPPRTCRSRTYSCASWRAIRRAPRKCVRDSADSGVPMSDRVHLRPWQREAFDKFAASEQQDFLAVATPGAGKTTFALACARWALGDERRRLVIVAPTTHLKTQWARSAHTMGLHVDHHWSPADGVAKDVHGIVTTYQQVSNGDTAKKLRGLSSD